MKYGELVGTLIAQIIAVRKKKHAPMLIVGIEGKGCAGKSRLSLALKEGLKSKNIPADIVSIDDFCQPQWIRYNKKTQVGLQVYENNFDQEQFLKKILIPTFEKKSIVYDDLVFDPITDDFTNKLSLSLPYGGVLLIEGLHILKRIFSQYFDYSIFLFISDEEQLKRALQRDHCEHGKELDTIISNYKSRLVPSYNYFIKNDEPLNFANMIIDIEDIERPRIVEEYDVRKTFL